MKPIPIEVRRKPGTEDVPMPKYMSEHASGMDVCAAVDSPTEIPPGQVRLIPTGLFIAVPPGYEAPVRARSGLALKHGIFVVNGPGTIDADYRGEVGVILGNFGPKPFVVERGSRVAQLVVQSVCRAEWQPVPVLSETLRNDGGFGHTGHQPDNGLRP